MLKSLKAANPPCKYPHHLPGKGGCTETAWLWTWEGENSLSHSQCWRWRGASYRWKQQSDGIWNVPAGLCLWIKTWDDLKCECVGKISPWGSCVLHLPNTGHLVEVFLFQWWGLKLSSLQPALRMGFSTTVWSTFCKISNQVIPNLTQPNCAVQPAEW